MSHFKRIQRIAQDHRDRVVDSFHASHRHARKLMKKHRVVLRDMQNHATRTAAVAAISAGVLAGPVMASNDANAPAFAPSDARTLQTSLITQQTGAHYPLLGNTPLGPATEQASLQSMIPAEFKEIVPTYTPTQTREQEAALEALIAQRYGVPARAELEGIRLNATQGIIAGEQHLPLYPGDTLASHTSDPTKHLTGMVPGLPSWGYFAPNKHEVTQEDIMNERYYIAAQTFLSPGWSQNVEKYYQWYKYRKMVVINPETSEAVVAVIGDAGPSPRTGRTFGGSNEVLMGLGLGKKRTGHVYVFFVDDPNNTIPLGPIGGVK